MPQKVSAAVICAALVTLIAPLSGAQTLPGGATPGGAMPDVSEQRRPAPRSGAAVFVPPVLDRLGPGDTSGPRIAVSRFDLYANRNTETAWRGGRYIADVERQLAEALAGQPSEGFTLGQIEAITQSIETGLREEGLVLAQVFIPVQQVASGVVAIEVMEGQLGKVLSQGNESYADTVLRKPLAAIEGKAVDNDSIEEALLLVRDYPGIAVAGVLSPGDTLGATDLTLRVQDEDPISFSTTLDNHGSEFTGEIRTLAQVEWNNPFHRADRLSFAALKSWEPQNGVYGSVAYTTPILGPGNYLNASFIQNAFDISASQVATTNLDGDTQIWSLGLTRAFQRSRDLNITGSIDLSSKRAEVVDETNGVAQAEDKLTVLDVVLSFDQVDNRFRGINNGFIGFGHGYADLLGSLDEGDPGVELGSSRRNQAGTFAGGKFDKWYGQFSRLQQITDTSQLLLRLAAQASDDLIISLEQMALGGPNSVRAYTPAEFLVDTGGFASLEYIISAPGFSDREAFRGFNWGELLRLSLFYDYAGGYLSEASFGEQKTRDISGYGLGIDFRLPGSFWTRLDLAYPAGSEDPSDGDDPQFYFTFNLAF